MHRALELRGEISKAATIRGAARFQGNTVYISNEWGIMICITCVSHIKFSLKTKGYITFDREEQSP